MNGLHTASPPAPAQARPWPHLMPILRPWRGTLALAMLGVLASKVLEMVPPLLVQRIVDAHLTVQRPDGLLTLGLLYLGASAAAQVLNGGAVYLTARAAQGALHTLRVRLVAQLQRLPLDYYDRTPLGDTISRCTADVETIDTLFSTGVINLVANLVRLLTAAAALLYLSPALTLLALLVVPPLLLVTHHFRLRVRAAEGQNRRAVGQLTTHLQETLTGVEVIRAFGRGETFVARFRAALRESLAASNRATVYSALYSPLMALLAAATTALLLWAGAGGGAVAWGGSVGTLTAFVLLFQRFFEPITTLGDDWQTVQSALSGIERIVEVLALPPETRPATQPAAPTARAIELRGVVFGYTDRPVLRGVSLGVRPGEHVALVGRTGAGKSSLLHLAGGLYAPWSGTVQVAGRDPRALDDEERRRVIGVVPQTVQLFSGTVWDNLTLGDPSVTPKEVKRAARFAGADAWIAALPQGYATPLRGAGRGVGVQLSAGHRPPRARGRARGWDPAERGLARARPRAARPPPPPPPPPPPRRAARVQLSAGQRQQLALARALVWNPAVLLLDEATAAIDTASDAALWAALRADLAGQGRAVLTVAHRIATAQAADRVIVLEAGQIVEQGPPEELVRRGGRFAALVEIAAAGWDWQAT